MSMDNNPDGKDYRTVWFISNKVSDRLFEKRLCDVYVKAPDDISARNAVSIWYMEKYGTNAFAPFTDEKYYVDELKQCGGKTEHYEPIDSRDWLFGERRSKTKAVTSSGSKGWGKV